MPDFKSLLLRWGWVIVACALLGGTGAWIASANMPSLFRARQAISMVPADLDWRVRDLTKELAFNSTARFPQAALVEQVASEIGLPAADIASALNAAFDNVTLIITIESHHSQAEVAVAMATAAAQAYFADQTAYFAEQEFTGLVDFEMVGAESNVQQLAPNVLKNTLAGLVLGLAIGMVLVLMLLWQEEERLAQTESIGRSLELPVLGQLSLD